MSDSIVIGEDEDGVRSSNLDVVPRSHGVKFRGTAKGLITLALWVSPGQRMPTWTRFKASSWLIQSPNTVPVCSFVSVLRDDALEQGRVPFGPDGVSSSSLLLVDGHQ